MSKKLPWYKWYPIDHQQSTRFISDEADLLYRRLLDEIWLLDGVLPKQLQNIAKTSRYQLRKFKRVWPEVSPFFYETEEGFRHEKVDEALRQVTETKEKKQKAALVRWENERIAAAMHMHKNESMHLQCNTDTDTDINNINIIYAKTFSESSPFIFLKGGEKYEIDAEYFHQLTIDHPDIEVTQHLREIYLWTKNNPGRCKTKRGVKRFINSWLTRSEKELPNGTNQETSSNRGKFEEGTDELQKWLDQQTQTTSEDDPPITDG